MGPIIGYTILIALAVGGYVFIGWTTGYRAAAAVFLGALLLTGLFRLATHLITGG